MADLGRPRHRRRPPRTAPAVDESWVGQLRALPGAGVVTFETRWIVGGADSEELWRTDGTEAGTYVLAELDSFGGSYPTAAGRVFFENGDDLYATDGIEQACRLEQFS